MQEEARVELVETRSVQIQPGFINCNVSSNALANPALFPAHKYGDCWWNSDDVAERKRWPCRQARRQTLSQTCNLGRIQASLHKCCRMLTHLVSTSNTDRGPFVFCLFRCTGQGTSLTCKATGSRMSRVDARGASCPSQFRPNALNKEYCCEEIRTVDGNGDRRG